MTGLHAWCDFVMGPLHFALTAGTNENAIYSQKMTASAMITIYVVVCTRVRWIISTTYGIVINVDSSHLRGFPHAGRPPLPCYRQSMVARPLYKPLYQAFSNLNLRTVQPDGDPELTASPTIDKTRISKNKSRRLTRRTYLKLRQG